MDRKKKEGGGGVKWYMSEDSPALQVPEHRHGAEDGKQEYNRNETDNATLCS